MLPKMKRKLFCFAWILWLMPYRFVVETQSNDQEPQETELALYLQNWGAGDD